MDMIAYTLNWTKDSLWRRLFKINQYETTNGRFGKICLNSVVKTKKEAMTSAQYLQYLQQQEFEVMYGIDHLRVYA